MRITNFTLGVQTSAGRTPCQTATTPLWLRTTAVLALTTAAACASTTGPSGSPDPSVPSNVSCAVFPDGRTAPYTLPYAVGRRYKVTRTFDHYLPSNGGVGLYAIDFDLPMRTPVHAARAGDAVAVEERFSDDDHATYHENWVMVRHVDGTVARYIHLAQGGAAVDVKETVEQGQIVGYSGNSGGSNGPHLHFDVQTCGPNLPPRYNDAPCGMTVPLSFRNTTAHSCGLDPKQSYAAEGFVPDRR